MKFNERKKPVVPLPVSLDTILSSKPGSKVPEKYMMANRKSSKNEASDTFSIPTAHPEYEKQMQKYEELERRHMKVAFEMRFQ